MAKVKIYVNKAFKLLDPDTKQHADYPVGNHTVEKEVAEHWFVKAHTGAEPPLDPDAQAAADELMAELDARAQALQAQAKDLDAREKLLAGRVRDAEQRDADLAKREQGIEAKAKEVEEAKAKADAAAKASSK